MDDMKQEVYNDLFGNENYRILSNGVKSWVMQVEFNDELSMKTRMDERISVYNQFRNSINPDSVSNEIVKQLESAIVSHVVAVRETKNAAIVKDGIEKVGKINKQIEQGKVNVSKSFKAFLASGAVTVLGSGGLVNLATQIENTSTAIGGVIPISIVAGLTLWQANRAMKSYNDIIEKGAPVRAGLQQIFPLQTSIMEAGGPRERRKNPSGMEKFAAIMSMMPKIKTLSDYFSKTR